MGVGRPIDASLSHLRPCTGHGINDRAGARCRRGGFAACSTPLFTTREKYARITSRATFARAAAHRHLRFCDKGSVANHARQNRQVRLPKQLNRVAQYDAKMCAQRKPTLRLSAVHSNQLSYEADLTRPSSGGGDGPDNTWSNTTTNNVNKCTAPLANPLRACVTRTLRK